MPIPKSDWDNGFDAGFKKGAASKQAELQEAVAKAVLAESEWWRLEVARRCTIKEDAIELWFPWTTERVKVNRLAVERLTLSN